MPLTISGDQSNTENDQNLSQSNTFRSDNNLSEDTDSEELSELILEIQTWVKSQPHLGHCRTDPNFLLRFLRHRKFQVTESCHMLERYLTMRAKHPQWFQNLDIQDPTLTDLVSRGYVFALPSRDRHGRRIVFSCAGSLDPKIHSSSEAMRAHIITLEALLEEDGGEHKGFTYIFDCSDMKLSHLSIWSPTDVSKILSVCEKNLPIKHYDINLLNLPFPMWAAFEFCKQFLSEKIRSRFCVHKNLESLVDKFGREDELLPLEYGGKVPLNQMTREWGELLEQKRDQLLDLDRVAVADIELSDPSSTEKKGSLWGLF